MPRLTFYLADQNPHRDRSLGISGYSLALMRALACKEGVQIQALASRSSIVPPPDVTANVRILPWKTDRFAGRLLTDHAHQPFLPSADIYHYPKGYLPVLTPLRRPVVATVHDTIIEYYAEHYPQYRSRLDYAYWQYQLKNTLRRADLILSISEFTRQEMLRFCDRYRIKMPPVVVTYEGAAGEEFAGQTLPKEDYVMAFASPAPHKKTERLLELWQGWKSRQETELLLLGSLSPRATELLSLCPQVRHVPFLEANALLQMLQKARALIMPSEIEGFSLPTLEAIYAGTPVVFVRETVVEEVLGSAGRAGFVLDDSDSFAEAMEKALQTSIAQSVEDAHALKARFAWQSVGDRTLQAYDDLRETRQ